MSDIRFNQWLHNSGTGGVSQVDGGHVGIGTTNPLIPVGAGNTAILNVGIVTANSFYGNGSNLSGVLTNIVEDTSPQLGGNLDCNNKNISLNDSTGGTNNRIKIGTHDDLQLWHNSSTGNSNISNYNGNLYLQGNNGSGTGVNQIAILSNAAVELNYQGNKKIETTNTGVTVTGTVAAAAFTGDGSSLSNLPASAPAGGASTNSVFFENDKLVEVNYQITSTKNAMSAGPVSISAGIAVTVPSGCSWTIV